MPDAEEALDVVPHGQSEHGRVHGLVAADAHVGQLADDAELLIQHLGHRHVVQLLQGAVGVRRPVEIL